MNIEEFNSHWPDGLLKDFPMRLMGVRGYFLDEGIEKVNDMGIFDDAIFRCIDKEVTMWRASTDPGRYYIAHPLNPSGCAQLRPGLSFYRLGRHLNNHDALVQGEEFTVNRLDQTGKVIGIDRGYFGINMHSGGAEYQVGRWSAGCQVIQCPEGAWGATWQAFFQPIQSIAPKRIPYLLIEDEA